jgi:hypothetical protein
MKSYSNSVAVVNEAFPSMNFFALKSPPGILTYTFVPSAYTDFKAVRAYALKVPC